MDVFSVLVLGLVEGLTEFLPVSSTGHMILAALLLNLQDTDFLKTFEVAIQLGAIMAVVILYRKRLLAGIDIYLRLGTAFVPAAIIGFWAYKSIKVYLFNAVVVSWALIIGGIILVALDRWIEEKPATHEIESLPAVNSFWIGIAQCFSMIPGVSRAGATIIGGLMNGLDKKQATEFSFLLAIPTMLAATGYDLLKNAHGFSSQEFGLLAMGGLVAFGSAWLAVKWFIHLVVRFGFRFFGYYRIGLGVLFLALIYMTGLKVVD